MKNIIILAICAMVSTYIYKKIKLMLLEKNHTSVTSSLSASLSFIVSFILLISIFTSIFPNNESISKNTKDIRWSINTDKKTINNIISNDLKNSEPLTREILSEIKSYKEDTDDRFMAEIIYIKYGVSYSEFNSVLKSTPCFNNYKKAMKNIQLYYKNETSNWIPYSEFKRTIGGGDILQAEIDYRDRYNKSYAAQTKDISDKFEKCQWETAQSMDRHLIRNK